MAFTLDQAIVGDDIPASRVTWEPDPVTITANEALAADNGAVSPKPCEEADRFLNELFGSGRIEAEEVRRQASDAGLAWRTIVRAKVRLKIRSQRDGFGKGATIYWLPGCEPNEEPEEEPS